MNTVCVSARAQQLQQQSLCRYIYLKGPLMRKSDVPLHVALFTTGSSNNSSSSHSSGSSLFVSTAAHSSVAPMLIQKCLRVCAFTLYHLSGPQQR
eukprot:9137-Heterococcus_DN1.PRE.2